MLRRGAQRPLTYVAIGASDTVGTGADDPQREGWAALVFARLPAGSRFARLGVSGALTGEALAGQVTAAEAAHPDLATVWLGVNDFNTGVTLEHYAPALEEVVRRIAGTGARTFVGNLPNLIHMPAYAELPPLLLLEEIGRWNATIASVAQRHGAVLIDLMAPSSQLESQPWLLAEDGFHPSTEGHRALAEVFWKAISEDPVIGPRIQASTYGR